MHRTTEVNRAMADPQQKRPRPNRGTADQQPATPPARDADRIARRAYERYEARGRGEGGDLDDWYEAEREMAGSPSEAASDRLTGDENQID